MENKVVTVIIYIILAVVGLLLSFFVVFNFMFTDTGGVFERAITFALTAVVYGIVGALSGFIRPRKWKVTAVIISLPALAITLLYSFREVGYLWLNLIYFIVAAAFVFLGAYLVSRVKLARS